MQPPSNPASTEQRHPARNGAEGLTQRSYRRAPEGERRRELIQATLDCVRDLGLQGATVRNVAERAGVTNGLIRHYFASKDEMVQAAYRETIERMTRPTKAASETPEASAAMRLRLFITTSLSPPALDERTLSLWASFISLIHVDEAMAEIHREGYSDFRAIAEALVREIHAEAGETIARRDSRRLAIKINAIIDGLWLEGSLAGDLFKNDALVDIGIEAVEAVLGLSLDHKNV